MEQGDFSDVLCFPVLGFLLFGHIMGNASRDLGGLLIALWLDLVLGASHVYDLADSQKPQRRHHAV